jgi:hypothetical protein
MRLLVHRIEYRIGHPIGVVFGRANGREAYALVDTFEAIDLARRLEDAQMRGRVVLDIRFEDHKVAPLHIIEERGEAIDPLRSTARHISGAGIEGGQRKEVRPQ